MKKIILLFGLVILLFLNSSCSSDDREITPLPNGVIIELTNKNLSEGTVSLIATQTNGTQIGQWSIQTENETEGQFETNSNSLTRFTGSILEVYEVRWTIDNGEESIYNNLRFLMCHNEPIEQVVQIERNIPKLIHLTEINVFTLEDLVSAGITYQELLDNNLTISELLNHFEIDELYDGGITITQMLNEGLTLEFIWNNFINSINHLNTAFPYFINEGIQIDDLVNVGATTFDLYEHGATLQQLVDSDLIPLKEIIELYNIDLFDLLPLNIPQQTLIDEGIIEETPTAGFYIMNYLFDSVESNTHSSFIDYLNSTYPNGNSLWRIPTYDELTFIYNNKASLDLKLDSRNVPLMYRSSTIVQCYPRYTGQIFKNLDNGYSEQSCSGNIIVEISYVSLLPVIQL